MDRGSLAQYLTAESKVYGLGYDIMANDPAYPPRDCVMYTSRHRLYTLTYHDDYFMPCTNGVASQLDGLERWLWGDEALWQPDEEVEEAEAVSV